MDAYRLLLAVALFLVLLPMGALGYCGKVCDCQGPAECSDRNCGICDCSPCECGNCDCGICDCSPCECGNCDCGICDCASA
jgi:hypothetical protein